jgi:hypothetical protein
MMLSGIAARRLRYLMMSPASALDAIRGSCPAWGRRRYSRWQTGQIAVPPSMPIVGDLLAPPRPPVRRRSSSSRSRGSFRDPVTGRRDSACGRDRGSTSASADVALLEWGERSTGAPHAYGAANRHPPPGDADLLAAVRLLADAVAAQCGPSVQPTPG